MKPDEEFKKELISNIERLKQFALVKMRERHLAEELAQDTLAQALTHWRQYQPGTKMIAWLFTIMENLRAAEYRKLKTRKVLLEGYRLDVEHDVFASAPEGIDRIMLKQTGDIIEALPVEQKEALYLVAVEGYSYDEAADILKTQVGTVKSRVSRARERLLQVFDEDYKGGPKKALKIGTI